MMKEIDVMHTCTKHAMASAADGRPLERGGLEEGGRVGTAECRCRCSGNFSSFLFVVVLDFLI